MKDIYGEEVTVTPPNISRETMEEMEQFFLKTSIPRILADYKAEKKGGENLSCHYKKSQEA
ncbi:hypothetical protein [Pseudobacillus badius]|uniref:hypothetical protein n=1 Tax=Bacillus badius TaxID=1455 RepID=UPI0007B3E6A1|nr:hypothetical protein [Bacillus badius]KZR60426.1 hypothetical protein A3781_09650 [Bacillus badius]